MTVMNAPIGAMSAPNPINLAIFIIAILLIARILYVYSKSKPRSLPPKRMVLVTEEPMSEKDQAAFLKQIERDPSKFTIKKMAKYKDAQEVAKIIDKYIHKLVESDADPEFVLSMMQKMELCKSRDLHFPKGNPEEILHSQVETLLSDRYATFEGERKILFWKDGHKTTPDRIWFGLNNGTLLAIPKLAVQVKKGEVASSSGVSNQVAVATHFVSNNQVRSQTSVDRDGKRVIPIRTPIM